MDLFGRKANAKLQIERANNYILLTNAEELREQLRTAEKTIRSLEEDNQALREESFKTCKKPRKKEESAKTNTD